MFQARFPLVTFPISEHDPSPSLILASKCLQLQLHFETYL